MVDVVAILSLVAMIVNGVVAGVHFPLHLPFKRPGAKSKPPAPDYWAWIAFFLARAIHVYSWLAVYTDQAVSSRSDGDLRWSLPVGITAAYALDLLCVAQLVSGNGFASIASVFSVLIGALGYYFSRDLTLNDNIGHFVVGSVLVLLPLLIQMWTSGLANTSMLFIGYALIKSVLIVLLVGLTLLKANLLSDAWSVGIWFGFSMLITIATLVMCYFGIKWHWLKSVFMKAAANVAGMY